MSFRIASTDQHLIFTDTIYVQLQLQQQWISHKSVFEGFLTFTFQNVSNFEKRTHLRFLCSRPCTWTTIPMSHRQNEINYDKNYIESRATCFWAVSTCSNHFDLFQPVSTHTKNWIWVCQKMIKNGSSNGLEISGIIWKSIPCSFHAESPGTTTNQTRWAPGSAAGAAAGPFAGPLLPFLGEPYVNTPCCVVVWVVVWVIACDNHGYWETTRAECCLWQGPNGPKERLK